MPGANPVMRVEVESNASDSLAVICMSSGAVFERDDCREHLGQAGDTAADIGILLGIDLAGLIIDHDVAFGADLVERGGVRGLRHAPERPELRK